MKKIVYPHISEIIGRIKYFVYATDGIDAVFGSSIIYDDDMQAEVDALLSLPNERFANVPVDRLQKISDVQVIDRAVHLCKEKLSDEQIDIITREYQKKYAIKLSDVQEILDKFRHCNDIYLSGYRKNNEFIKKYGLTNTDILNIIHSLTVNDYKSNTKDIVYPYLGDVLMIFKKHDVQLPQGSNTSIVIYIKLDIDESTDDTIAILSIHEDE